MKNFKTLYWENGQLVVLDQTRLPNEIHYEHCKTIHDVWTAIKQLKVRGAPAIGVAAAYGVVLGCQTEGFHTSIDYLASSRPTAVNLFWALERMRKVTPATLENLLAEAHLIYSEDEEACRKIGENGISVMPLLKLAGCHNRPLNILTHCNAGALAATNWGTALAPLYVAHERSIRFHVFVDETRPLNQGSRLTAWELMQEGISCTLITDSMAAHVMRTKGVDMVIVGADRIAANGDTANKIGTYSLALAAKAHNTPFYVAAPSNTFDLSLEDGSEIPIEERNPEEVYKGFGRVTAPEGVCFFMPAFDVTPSSLITAFITEKGIVEPGKVMGFFAPK